MFTRNQRVTVRRNNQSFPAVVVAVDSRGVWVRRFDFHNTELCVNENQVSAR